MIGKLSLGLALMVFAAAVAPAAAATDQVGVLVVDRNGAPVRDAVVMLTPRDGVAAPGDASAPRRIRQKNREYLPFVSVVRRGGSVTFANDDAYGHHVYSFSKAKRFERANPSGTETDPVVMDKAGVVALGCNIHDDMLAYIYVTDTPYFALTGDDGRARIDGVAAGRYTATVWHPRARGKPAKSAVSLAVPAAAGLKFALDLRKPRKKPKPSPYGYGGYGKK